MGGGGGQPPPRPDGQYGLAGINLTKSCAVVQLGAHLIGGGEPQHVCQEHLVVQRGANKGGFVPSGQGRRGGVGVYTA
jgi:hypothetical protein